MYTDAGHLDMTYDSGAGHVVWRTCRDEQQRLVPYTYDVGLVGTDPAGDPMRLDLHVTPSRAPVPLGGAAYNGKIECFGQAGTYSYFQTGMTMTGTLRWGSIEESVTGSAGHVDRQWFPLIANSGGPDGNVRARSHEWRTINLDNGVDLSIWRQFDRTNHNALQPFSGATTSSGDADPEFADDIEVTVTSYVRWPESVSPLVRPPSRPDTCRTGTGSPHASSIWTWWGSRWWRPLRMRCRSSTWRARTGISGTLRGKPVSGFAFYERSLALYRDWELDDVLAAAEPGERELVLEDIAKSRA